MNFVFLDEAGPGLPMWLLLSANVDLNTASDSGILLLMLYTALLRFTACLFNSSIYIRSNDSEN